VQALPEEDFSFLSDHRNIIPAFGFACLLLAGIERGIGVFVYLAVFFADSKC